MNIYASYLEGNHVLFIKEEQFFYFSFIQEKLHKGSGIINNLKSKIRDIFI